MVFRLCWACTGSSQGPIPKFRNQSLVALLSLLRRDPLVLPHSERASSASTDGSLDLGGRGLHMRRHSDFLFF